MRTEQEFLSDVLTRLNQISVAYMLTGSMASNYWGTPRTTHDIDLVILLKRDEVDRLAAAFSEGFFVQRESVNSVFRPPYQFNIIDEQSALKADFWQLRDNVFEQQMFSRRLAVDLFSVPAWIATAEDIILHKLIWNSKNPSDRQLNDAAGVFAVQRQSLDMLYLAQWALNLGLEGVLNDLIEGRLRPKST
jgi:hypothetical protein